ncbi:hypothetical protein GCM10010911_55790 [Paenibacillus nasutitermitis]|uniref:Uncharacterized protein n=1 Tax=Paenibacillus nasutitermitis TaxID=1652958 RepID=A0A917E0P4_9BACL|nr:hypothetical protein GCM10010911_55790 [Paenibacillus nasutitermitis]
MKILFCSDPLDSKIIDQEYEQEYKLCPKSRDGCPYDFTGVRFGWIQGS